MQTQNITNNQFSITLTPLQALQTKRGYELEGYAVNMMEISQASFIDNTFKYFFTLKASQEIKVLQTNNLLVGANNERLN